MSKSAKKRTPMNRAIWCAVAGLDPRPVNPAPHLAGGRNPAAKLTDAEVTRLRKLYRAARELGCTHTSAAVGMAACFSVHPRTVGKYVWGERRAEAQGATHQSLRAGRARARA